MRPDLLVSNPCPSNPGTVGHTPLRIELSQVLPFTHLEKAKVLHPHPQPGGVSGEPNPSTSKIRVGPIPTSGYSFSSCTFLEEGRTRVCTHLRLASTLSRRPFSKAFSRSDWNRNTEPISSLHYTNSFFILYLPHFSWWCWEERSDDPAYPEPVSTWSDMEIKSCTIFSRASATSLTGIRLSVCTHLSFHDVVRGVTMSWKSSAAQRKKPV